MSSKTKKYLIINSALVILLISMIAFFHFDSIRTKSETKKSEPSLNTQEELSYIEIDSTRYSYSDNISAYLLMGTDNTSALYQENLADDIGIGGDMADTLVLAVFNKTQNSYALYPIDRNTMTDVPLLDGEDGTAYEQICISHWYGQTEKERNENTVETVSDLLGGLSIDGYAKLKMSDIAKVNDAIGGVSITLPEDMTFIDRSFTKGETVLLEGAQAEQFLRARRNMSNDLNEKRMERQELYLQKASTMITDQLRENPQYINELRDELDSVIDTNISERDFADIINIVSTGTNLGIKKFSYEAGDADAEYEEAFIDGQSIRSALSSCFELKEDFGRVESND